MKNNIKFSILLPTYNRGYIISKAIDSVLNQDFNNWELIIIDDGSKDNTFEIISNYKDDRIKYFKFDKNFGVNIARNKAIDLAKGEYVLLLDSDNYLTNNILSEYYDLTLNKKYNYFKFPCLDQRGVFTVDQPKFVGTITYKSFLSEKKKGEYATLVKLNLLKNIKFFEDIKGGEGITWKLIAKQTNVVRYESLPGLIYDNTSKDRLSLKNKNYNRLAKVFLKDIMILGFDYFRYSPFFLFKNIIKFIIYKIFSIFIK